MEIRLAGGGDIAAVQDIQNHYIAATHIHFAAQPLTLEEGLAEWRGAREKHPWLVSVDGGRVVGFARSSAWKARAAYQWTVETAVYLRPEACGRGVGRALYERLFAVLRAQGYRTAIGGITQPNEASVRLHEAVGMHRCATFERAGFKFGKWWTVGYWRMDLGGTEGEPGPILMVADALRIVA
ncbi:MAG: N-acetyltransferase [Phycisphaerales bacterium]|nr:N-acetyltransferase [Phycisphaerales bacterium]